MPISMTDELLNLVQTLHVCVCEAAQVSTKIYTADIHFFVNCFVICYSIGERLLIVLVYTACICVQDIRPDEDLVLDILLYLWAKCKLVFQRAQARHNDPVSYMVKMAFPDKVVICQIVLF